MVTFFVMAGMERRQAAGLPKRTPIILSLLTTDFPRA